jgi:hypothetical protein
VNDELKRNLGRLLEADFDAWPDVLASAKDA